MSAQHSCVRFHWRRGGDWDVAAQRFLVEEHGCDPFMLCTLKNIAAGREPCGGCYRRFRHTREVALITEWWASTRTWPSEPCMVAYCLSCTQTHADAIADLSERAAPC